MKHANQLARIALCTTFIATTAITFAACGSSSTKGSASKAQGGSTQGGASRVLPVSSNPIRNTSIAEVLKIDSVLVENNVDPATKKTADDHLEITLVNTSTTDLRNVEIYYTFSDPKTNATESYYTKLPATFTISGRGKRIVHFDNTGVTGHFPENKFSLYRTDQNEMNVTVVVSADGAAVQTANLKKDAGGPELKD